METKDNGAQAARRVGPGLEETLSGLAQMGAADLRREWRKVFGKDPSSGVYRDLMLRMLAYRRQAAALGDLDRATREALTRLAKGDEAILDQARPRLKPGTTLVREWKGVLHKVTVTHDGYAWEGKTFVSLSAAARAIAGTQWNGPIFFGLKSKKRRRTGAVADARA